MQSRNSPWTEANILHWLWWADVASILEGPQPLARVQSLCSVYRSQVKDITRPAPKSAANSDTLKPLCSTQDHRPWIAYLTELFFVELIVHHQSWGETCLLITVSSLSHFYFPCSQGEFVLHNTGKCTLFALGNIFLTLGIASFLLTDQTQDYEEGNGNHKGSKGVCGSRN